MTVEDLDVARAKEAYDLMHRACWGSRVGTLAGLATAARLAREGWKPDDPLLKEARVLACGVAAEPGALAHPDYVQDVESGNCDHTWPVRLARAALKRGMELGRQSGEPQT